VSEAEDRQDEVEDAPRPAYGSTRAPRSPRLSRANVFQAADAVLLAGGRVTIDRVRNHLGRGSPNTIQEHLDAWWSKLGSRLRDIPGREFPELPDDVAKALQGLWNTALDSAYAAIDGKAATRDAELATREAALAGREVQFVEQTEAAAARGAALEESLALAREQLAATNNRADRLETLLQTRESEADRLRARADSLDAETRELRGKLDAAAEAHQAERAKLDERHAANEARWLVEIDRGRQAAKETVKDHERQLKELRAQLAQLHTQRDELKRDLQAVRAELRTAVSHRAQAEKRLAAMVAKSAKTRPATPTKSVSSRKDADSRPRRSPSRKRRR
jgi:Plasmid replication region DNA-binding N-term